MMGDPQPQATKAAREQAGAGGPGRWPRWDLPPAAAGVCSNDGEGCFHLRTGGIRKPGTHPPKYTKLLRNVEFDTFASNQNPHLKESATKRVRVSEGRRHVEFTSVQGPGSSLRDRLP